MRVVEVDRERGRIGLRLADDPDVAGKSAEELATVGTGGGNGGGPAATVARAAVAAVTATADRVARRRRRPRRRPWRARLRPSAPPVQSRSRAGLATLQEQHQLTQLDSGVRVVTEHISSVRSVALGLLDRHGQLPRRPATRPASRT